MKPIYFFLLILFLLLFTTCSNNPTELQIEQLKNTTWVLEQFQISNSFSTPPSNQRYEITLLDNNKLEGWNDCNEISATYELNGASLKIYNIGGTKLACGDNSKEQEFKNGLLSTTKFNIENNKLKLSQSPIDVSLVFKKK